MSTYSIHTRFWVFSFECKASTTGLLLGPRLRNYTELFMFLNIRGSVHRNSRLKKFNEMQQYAGIYLPLNYSKCFGRPSRPSSGVHKTVVTVSGTHHTVWGASFFKCDHGHI